jgi:hypothetical protein
MNLCEEWGSLHLFERELDINKAQLCCAYKNKGAAHQAILISTGIRGIVVNRVSGAVG